MDRGARKQQFSYYRQLYHQPSATLNTGLALHPLSPPTWNQGWQGGQGKKAKNQPEERRAIPRLTRAVTS